MLLWEALRARLAGVKNSTVLPENIAGASVRLPFDKRCSAITKSGKRCKGKIREGSEHCFFHDPALTLERKRQIAAKGGRRHHRLSHLPDGYLRKLTSLRAVGQAMDRLYREVRLGIVTPEMGQILFTILTRIMDSGILKNTSASPTSSSRARAHQLRPKLSDLLTRAELTAWRKAVANAPAIYLHTAAGKQAGIGEDRRAASENPVQRPLTAAS